MDSTGLKTFGEEEWRQKKHKTKVKREGHISLIAGNQLPGSRRKLHHGLDLATGEIICADSTLDCVGDATALAGLTMVSHRHETRSQAHNPYPNFHFEIDTLLKYKSVAAWPDNPEAGIISAAELKPRWGAGRRS